MKAAAVALLEAEAFLQIDAGLFLQLAREAEQCGHEEASVSKMAAVHKLAEVQRMRPTAVLHCMSKCI